MTGEATGEIWTWSLLGVKGLIITVIVGQFPSPTQLRRSEVAILESPQIQPTNDDGGFLGSEDDWKM